MKSSRSDQHPPWPVPSLRSHVLLATVVSVLGGAAAGALCSVAGIPSGTAIGLIGRFIVTTPMAFVVIPSALARMTDTRLGFAWHATVVFVAMVCVTVIFP